MVPKKGREEGMEMIWDVIYLSSTVVFFLLTGSLLHALSRL